MASSADKRTVMQQQAGVLVEKEQRIADLEQRVRELEALHAEEKGEVVGEDKDEGEDDDDDGHAWESLPPPESFKEALEQILLLQVHLQSPFVQALCAAQCGMYVSWLLC
jgi:hypothetical protein